MLVINTLLIKISTLKSIVLSKYFRNRKIYKKHLNNITVVSIYGIGNCVLTIPLLKQIKNDLPKCKITYFYTNSSAIEIIPDKLIDKFIFYSDSNKISSKFLLSLFIIKTDIIIYTYPFTNNDILEITQIIQSKYRIGYNILKPNYFTHSFKPDSSKPEWLLNLNLYIKLFNKIKTINYHKPLIHFDDNKMDNTGIKRHGNFITIHPGAGGIPKQWPRKFFIELINKIYSNFNLDIILVGGPEEKEIGEEISRNCPNIINLIGKRKLIETARIIAKSKIFISNDSGLMHVAGAVGTPQIAIFGPTPIPKNRPWGNPKYKILLRSDCPPCYKDGQFPCTQKKLHKCLTDITPIMVYESLTSLLPKIK